MVFLAAENFIRSVLFFFARVEYGYFPTGLKVPANPEIELPYPFNPALRDCNVHGHVHTC
jgi:hypothetical protein